MHPGKTANVIFYNGNLFGVSGRSCEIILKVSSKNVCEDQRDLNRSLEVQQLSYPPRNGK